MSGGQLVTGQGHLSREAVPIEADGQQIRRVYVPVCGVCEPAEVVVDERRLTGDLRRTAEREPRHGVIRGSVEALLCAVQGLSGAATFPGEGVTERYPGMQQRGQTRVAPVA